MEQCVIWHRNGFGVIVGKSELVHNNCLNLELLLILTHNMSFVQFFALSKFSSLLQAIMVIGLLGCNKIGQ